MALALRKRPGIHTLRAWGQPIFFGALAAVSAGVSLRLILASASPEARWGGWYLLVVSLLIAIGALSGPNRRHATHSTADPTVHDPGTPNSLQSTAPAQASRAREAVIFFIAAFTFAWALPWVGFAIANGAFVAAYLFRIDHRRWWIALAAAAVIDAALVIAMNLLDVLLPTGAFGPGF